MSELSSQLNLFQSKVSEEIGHYQAEYDRWLNYKRDYEALERQLSTLPDTVSKQAMIPMGPLAFMPGKIIHTNEILVLLGDKYYAERTAKQAMEIVGRRKEVVEESLRLVKAQLNSAETKKASVLDSLQHTQYNEEGLPIMDIREELPPTTPTKGNEGGKNKGKMAQEYSPSTTTTAESDLPESVLRARRMMKEADEKIKQQKGVDNENKALFELLSELEAEEEEQEAAGIHNIIEKPPIYTKFMNADKEDDRPAGSKKRDSRFGSDDSDEEEDDDEEDERYDTEIADNLFDKFTDDPLEGVVDQEDFTTYEDNHSDEREEEEEEAETIETMTSSVKELYIEPKEPKRDTAKVMEKGFNDADDSDNERSTPRLITKMKKKKEKKRVTFADSVQPTQGELENAEERKKTIKSPADIFKVIRKSQNSTSTEEDDGDDYLKNIDTDEAAQSNDVDINELIQAARESAKEALYRPADGSDVLIPMVKERFSEPAESSESLKASSDKKEKKNSKLDNKIMKGAVMEHDIAPVDPEEVEEDMDLREITASYQQKRLNMLAATGSLSFEPKPEFEVFDEELPLPKKEEEKEEDIPEVKPKKKISRFKAARLGMRMDDNTM
ncbi:hypothetical protein BDF20DRAFT_716322 [Mycotypha africana]|uniref:uncharacterized protein n=1 Tax=Mycotypha africana TaxID=64632 RepID=UPI0023012C65|nr:uncharacterized protein BDF20DRAFT_716322 [Mycotypha africana]KAI8972032.1 hypothetical protein BDF20DRAFT_716322 [Mycotypha africana]